MSMLCDSSFVIDVLRRDRAALAALRGFEESGDPILLPAPSAYEVHVGLIRGGAIGQAGRFRRLTERMPIAPLDAKAAQRAAEVRAAMLQRGLSAGIVDVLIAGIAIAGGHAIATRDADYDAIGELFGLEIRGY